MRECMLPGFPFACQHAGLHVARISICLTTCGAARCQDLFGAKNMPRCMLTNQSGAKDMPSCMLTNRYGAKNMPSCMLTNRYGAKNMPSSMLTNQSGAKNMPGCMLTNRSGSKNMPSCMLIPSFKPIWRQEHAELHVDSIIQTDLAPRTCQNTSLCMLTTFLTC